MASVECLQHALRVLAACREALAGTDAVVREVSGNGAMWMEPTVEIKRPGEPPVVYGWIEPEDVPALLTLYADGESRLWVGTAEAGVFVYDGRETKPAAGLEALRGR